MDSRLLKDYFKVDGGPLKELNTKWIHDDYVKFIRFGQWRIDQSGAGILAFITNNSYLDSPTFKGMRQQLLNAFTSIYNPGSAWEYEEARKGTFRGCGRERLRHSTRGINRCFRKGPY